MKTGSIKNQKPLVDSESGLIVVKNLPIAKPSPVMQVRIDEAKEKLRQAKLPEGWR